MICTYSLEHHHSFYFLPLLETEEHFETSLFLFKAVMIKPKTSQLVRGFIWLCHFQRLSLSLCCLNCWYHRGTAVFYFADLIVAANCLDGVLICVWALWIYGTR